MQNGTIKKWVMGVLVATLLSMTWQGVFVRGQQVVRAATNMPTPTPAVSPTATPIKAPKGKLKRTQSTPITSGATHKIYQYTLQRGKDKPVAVVHVFEIDLTNPFVKVDLIMGYKNRLTTRASVLQMAKDSGAVAAMNADFFHMDERGLTSFGGSVQKGQLVTTPNNTRSLSGWYTFGLTKDKKPVIDFYTYASSLTTQSGLSQKIFAVNKEGSPYVAGDGSTTHTYKNRVMMFTSAWAREKRGQIDGLTPSEVLVQNGIVKQISLQKQISGRVPKKAVILSFDGTVAEKWLGGLAPKIKVGDTLAINTTFIPSNPMNPSHVEDFTMMVGGHSILINDGLQMKIPDEMYSGAQGSNYRSRTAIGYNKMMSKLYMVAVNRNDHSAGITLPEMTNIMLQLGCYKAMNLDGGGSTTVVTRPLGEMATSLASKVEFDSMRLVMNGIGVFSTAPKGILKDVTIFGPNTMLIGEQASYRLTGYDTYYNPVTVAAMKPVWSFDANFGQAKKATFQALKSGDTQVTVTAGPIKKSVPLHVIAGSDLVKLEMVTPVKLAKAGQAGEMVVYATTKSGDRKVVPDKALKWSFVGMNASVKAGTFAIKGVYKAAAAGKIVVNYDGFSSSLELQF
jgi:exopolysaccharide biosynthesis protein